MVGDVMTTWIFTGGRDYKNKDRALQTFISLVSPSDDVFVGCCPTGLDAMVREHFNNGWEQARVFKANWNELGRAAGPIRNGEMIMAAPPDAILVAFLGGDGTKDCIRQAKKRGLLILKVDE